MTRTLFIVSFLGTLTSVSSQAGAQFEDVPEFTPSVRVDVAEVPDLERAASLLASEQWDQAIETLRRVMEEDGERLIQLPDVGNRAETGYGHYVTVREFCHRQIGDLARAAPEALAIYRRRVDPLAKQWFEQARNRNDEKLFQRIVDELFNSSYGDDALLQLGDLALQRGQRVRARWCWERISPLLRTPNDGSGLLKAPAGTPWWLVLRGLNLTKNWERLLPLLTEKSGRTAWLAYPDTNLSLAEVRARLVLVSVFEKAEERAAIEFEVFRRLHRDAKGYLAGRRGRLVELLENVIAEGNDWPAEKVAGMWTTFAGDVTRQHVAEHSVDMSGHPLWQDIKLPRIAATNEMLGYGRARISEDAEGLLSYHPIVVHAGGVGPVVVWNEFSLVRAVGLRDGRPAWPLATDDDSDPQRKGWIFDAEKPSEQLLPRERAFIGAPRFTLTAYGNKLFVRMGGLRTSLRDRLNARIPGRESVLVGLDLDRQGRLLPGFPLRPENLSWQFEGSPVADGRDLFVAMRHSTPQGALPEVHVAAFDLHVIPPSPGEGVPLPRWRVKLCAANSPAGAHWDEVTHNLLAMREDSIYCNTNLGVVGAVSTDGEVRWITSYPRSAFRARDPDQSDLNYMRDLNPCLLFDDLVIVAPTDTDKVFALDANTGQLRWQISLADVVHLLGVGQGNLLAGGDSLYWIDVRTGKNVGQFPEPTKRPTAELSRVDLPGYGRGVLAGDVVYWPTREHIFVFKQKTRKIRTANKRFLWEPVGVRVIDLRPRGIQGGNLVIADGVLLITGPDRIMAFDQFGPETAE